MQAGRVSSARWITQSITRWLTAIFVAAPVLSTAGGCAARRIAVPPPGPTTFPIAEPVLVLAEDPPPALPPIPHVAGAPLAPAVVYPARNGVIATQDSNFVLGSVGSGDASLTINGVPVEVKPNGAFLAWLPVPPGEAPAYELVARRGLDSVAYLHPVQTPASRAALPPTVGAPPPQPLPSPRVVTLGVAVSADSAPDTPISIRPTPGGTYKWFAVPGTQVERLGEFGGFTRIRLDAALDAWVASSDVIELPDSVETPRRVVGNLAVVPDSEWTDVIFPLRSVPPYLVEEDGDRLVLTLYSTRATTDIIAYRSGDSVVRTVTWEPLTADRVRYTIHLRHAPFGYLVLHDGRALTLRVRRPPVVDAAQPLRGITVAVDAGHPPAGSRGPTGLYEADATLPIAEFVREELERRGATVLMTRTAPGPVPLGDRPALARRAHAHALVSIHLNAVPDGVNPYTAGGTGTYFFHPHSEPLARAVQAGMVRAMGLRDIGVFYDNLALVRPTWMPAILCEGAFIIIPEHEAAMSDPAGQRAYARGVARGVESYFRALSR